MKAEKMAREYAVELHRLGTITKTESYVAERAHYDGYLAGQQSLWREYPKEKPDNGQFVAVIKVYGLYKFGRTDWDDERQTLFHGPLVEDSFEQGDLWMPITLPATKEAPNE